MARLWWSAKLSFSKIVELPQNVWGQNVDANRHTFHFQNNGSYIISTSIDTVNYVSANDVVGSMSVANSAYISEYGIVSSSGTKTWYMTQYRADAANGFCYIDSNLVVSSEILNSVTIDYNNNYGGGSRSFKHLGVGAFFHFHYPRNSVVLVHENGTVSVLPNVIGAGLYGGYAKVSNYLISTTDNEYSWNIPAVNISNGVVQTFGTSIAYACGKSDDINGVTVVACGSPANSVTKVYAILNNLVCNQLTVPTELSSLPCIYYECVPYNSKFYFYCSMYTCFTVDLNYIFEIVEDPQSTSSRFSEYLGYDIFNGSMYLGLGNVRNLTGLLKGS